MTIQSTCTTPVISGPLSLSPVCESRTALLNQLAGTLENLRQASEQFDDLADLTDSSQIVSIRNKILTLRGECGNIRHELESHRASHGC